MSSKIPNFTALYQRKAGLILEINHIQLLNKVFIMCEYKTALIEKEFQQIRHTKKKY